MVRLAPLKQVSQNDFCHLFVAELKRVRAEEEHEGAL